MATYTILNEMANEICKKIKRIVKKCENNQIAHAFNVSDPYTKLVTVNKKSFEVMLIDLELDVTFKFNGWKSLGLVQRKDGIVQCYFDNADLIKQYKDTDFHCDHCHKKVHRNSVVILENAPGERKVVGTSCVKEFTSGLDGNLIAEANDYMRILEMRNSELDSLMNGECDEDSESFFERCGVQTYKVIDVVSAAKRVIDCRGFEPSDSMNATWKFIIDEYDRTKVENEALDAIEWIKSLSEDEVLKSNYLFNLRQIIDAGYCTARHFGFLASLIPSYRKSECKRLRDANYKESNYVGNVGDKLSVKVTYLETYTYDTYFGGSHIHLFMDDNGNIFKWSTGTGLRFTVGDTRSNDSQWYGLDRGAIIQLSGKIKEHSEYRNQKQTVLTRCKYEVLESKEKNAKIAELEEYYSKDHSAQTRDPLDDLMESWG
jgi:hypothetical protein